MGGATTPDGRRSANLDILRAVAAVAVLGMHANGLTTGSTLPADVVDRIRFNLWSGVDLFFVISGYLIGGPFVRSLLTGRSLPVTGPYLRRRVARIVPAYWVALGGILLVNGVALRPDLGLVSHILLIQNAVPGQGRALLPVAWTLGIEAAFYLLVPIAACVIRWSHPGPMRPGRLTGVIVATWAGSAAWAFGARTLLPAVGVGAGWQGVAVDSLPATMSFFCAGLVVATLEPGVRRRVGSLSTANRRRTVLMCAAAAATGWLVAIAVLGAPGAWQAGVADQVFALASALALVGALVAAPVRRVPLRLVAAVGVVSYGVYLWHWTVAVVIAHVHGIDPVVSGQGHLLWMRDALLLLGATLPIAAVSWVAVERPLIRLAGRRPRVDRGGDPGPAGGPRARADLGRPWWPSRRVPVRGPAR